MVAEISSTLFTSASLGALVVAIVISLAVLRRFEDEHPILVHLRERFVLGVPWGTVIVIVFVYAVYYLIQGGGDPGGPNVVGFRSWSLWYPQSILLGSFAHASDSHLVGNLLGTVAFAPIVEYAWSHYPTRRGSQSFSSWHTHPFVRIGIFAGGVVVVGVVESLLVPGAVIGFSGVVFAFAGFGLVARPLPTALAILGINVVGLVRRAFLDPVSVAVAEPRFVTPSWALTALQGHLLGLLVGVLLAVVVVRVRSASPNVRYIWFAALVFAVSRSLYAVYWFQGESEFVLFRALGTAGVFLLASLIALAALSRDPPLVERAGLRVRTTALALLLAVVCAIALAGVPYNVVPVSPDEPGGDSIDVRGYSVTYAEDVQDQYTALDLPVVRDALSVEVSGVIVTSDDRNVWALEKPEEELAFDGRSVVVLGDVTWRELVVVNRTQWATTGGNTTYKVYGHHWPDGDRHLLFTAENATASPTINGSRVRIEPTAEFYDLIVERNGSVLGRERVPAHNGSVDIAGITFERQQAELFAVHERTRIRIAEYSIEGRDRDR